MLQIRSIDKADLVEKNRSGVELRGSRIFEKEKKKSWKFNRKNGRCESRRFVELIFNDYFMVMTVHGEITFHRRCFCF